MTKERNVALVDRRNARLQKQLYSVMLSGDMVKARKIGATITKLERRKNKQIDTISNTNYILKEI